LSQADLFPSLSATNPKQASSSASIWANRNKKTPKVTAKVEKIEQQQPDIVSRKPARDWVDRPRDESPMTGVFIDHKPFHDFVKQKREYDMAKKNDFLDYENPMKTENDLAREEFLREAEYWDRKYNIEDQTN